MKKLIFSLVLSLAASTAHAMLINVDFGPSSSALYSGQGILGTSSDTTWNAVDYSVDYLNPSNPPVVYSDLALADGSGGSGVSVTTSFAASFSNYPGTASNSLLGDRILYGASASSTMETITFTGLAANSLYDIVLYNGYFGQTYSADGQMASTNPDASSPNSNYNDPVNPWTENVEYARLYSVMSDAGGQLVITVTRVPQGGESPPAVAVSGVQIASVPLPAALYLFVPGLAGLAGIGLRKRAS